MPLPPLSQRHPNPLQDDFVDFAPLLEGHLPQALVNGLGQIQAAVNDFGPGLSAYRPRRAAGPWGWAAGGNRNSFQRLDGSPSRYHFMS
jgi:hypothetical protein